MPRAVTPPTSVRPLRVLPSLVTLAVLAACGGGGGDGGGTEPPVAASVVAIVGAPATAQYIGTTLETTPTFEVRSSAGAALAGIPVTVAVTAGGGALAGAPAVSLAGPTPIGQWTLGAAAGAQTVTVTVAGVTPLVFTVQASDVAPVATSVTALQGAGQTAFAGAAVAVPPRVRVIDQYGRGLSGGSVTWSVVAGGGTLGGSATVATDATGAATAPTWTLGRRGGAQTLRATAGALATNFDATIQTSFNITLRYVGTAPTGAVAQAFTDAVNRIQAAVVGDVPGVQIGSASTPFDVGACGNPSVTGINLNETVDDVIIYAAVVPIDGVGQVLGSAGPCLTRNVDSLTALGTMRFDSADLDNLANQGRLSDVVLHEMLHVIGLGTLWNRKQLVVDTSTANVRVIGALAAATCANELGGAAVCPGSVPAENCLDLPGGTNCGAGTRNSHWKESTFQTELMTGYAGASNQFSLLTIRGLADLGYNVNALAADPYTVPSNLMAALRAAGDAGPAVELGAPLAPRFSVDRGGRVRRIVR